MPEYSTPKVTPTETTKIPGMNGSSSGYMDAKDLLDIIRATFGQANGVATLGSDGRLTSSQLPVLADDVIVASSYATLDQPGMPDKLYITADDNKMYRWDDTLATPDYVELSVDLSDYATKAEVADAVEDLEAADTDLKNAINFIADNTLKVMNLINDEDLIDNKYYDISNGNIYTGDGSTKATPLIEVSQGRYYLYTNTAGSQVFSGICIYDANKDFVRAITEYNFSVYPYVDIAFSEQYIGITIANAKVGHTALVSRPYFGLFKSIGNANNIIPPHMAKDLSLSENIIVVDKFGNGNFTRIMDAVNSISDDSANNPYTIFIKPGTYKEIVSIQGGRHISLIGANMKDCIIRDDTGLYENTPLQISGDFMVANLTIIATHDDNPSMPHTGNKAYAIHIDYAGSGTGIVRNCKLVSYQSSAIGAGLWQEQTLIIENCELRSYTPNASAWDESSDWTATPSYGALFVHSATDSNVTGQELTVKNCYLTSANKRNCAFSNSPDGTSNMTINLINNNLWCADGNADSTITEWYNPVYSGRSYGNNVAKLNAN